MTKPSKKQKKTKEYNDATHKQFKETCSHVYKNEPEPSEPEPALINISLTSILSDHINKEIKQRKIIPNTPKLDRLREMSESYITDLARDIALDSESFSLTKLYGKDCSHMNIDQYTNLQHDLCYFINAVLQYHLLCHTNQKAVEIKRVDS